jgi:hypothetical protein
VTRNKAEGQSSHPTSVSSVVRQLKGQLGSKAQQDLKCVSRHDYEIEDVLKDVEHIQLLPIRKKNSKRDLSPSISFVQSYHRKQVETAGSLLAQLLPKSIHAVTSEGFELKVALFVIAYSLNCYLNL